MRVEKFSVARAQLETAIWIFLNGLDRSSVCTLAGAASGILDNLVKRAGKEPFIDYARRVHQVTVGYLPKRRSYAHHIEVQFGITPNKHLAADDPDYLEIDLESSASDALARAVMDYVSLAGQDEPFVRAFLQDRWSTVNCPQMLEKYAIVPAELRPRP